VNITAITVEVSKLTLNPGDILVLKTKEKMSKKQIVDFRNFLKTIVPIDVQVVVLDAGMEFEVITPGEDDGQKKA
jgi:hypothetical protein